MIKRKIKKLRESRITLWIFTLLVLLLVILLLPWKSILITSGSVISTAYSRFEEVYRISIAKIIALLLALGILFWFLKTVLGTLNVTHYKDRVGGYFSQVKKKYSRFYLVLYLSLVVISTLLLLTVPFVYAFCFTALVLIYFLNKFQDQQRILIVLCGVIILLFYAPHLFWGENIHIKIFDTFDANVPQIKVLAESGKAFSLNVNTKLDNFINGLPLSGIYSGYNVIVWLYMIFKPITAYTVHLLTVAFIAFFGLLVLLKKYVVQDRRQLLVVAGTALCFALLPFYLPGGISVAGLPFLLYAFMNIRNKHGKFSDYLIVFIFPFYSRLALAGIFIIVLLGIMLLIDLIKEKKLNLPFLGSSLLIVLTYGFVNIQRLYSFFNPDFISHRAEIVPVTNKLAECLTLSIKNFIFDVSNSISAHHLFVMLAAVLALFYGMRKKVGKLKLLVFLVTLAMINAFLWGFKYFEGLDSLGKKYQVFSAFNFARFYFFNPFLWYLIFALSLLMIVKMKHGKKLVLTLIIFQLLFLFTNYNWNYRPLLGGKNKLKYSLTYKEFYSEELFKRIDDFINKPKSDYRIVCIGIHPGIAQHNGFYTLDVYANIYPLSYKQQFKKIMQKEFEKSPELKRGFKGNAKRCYLLVSELHGKKRIRGMAYSRGITKKDAYLKIKSLALNTVALKDLGGEYIFSAVEVLNHEENNLTLKKVFKSKISPWKIYLYKVK